MNDQQLEILKYLYDGLSSESHPMEVINAFGMVIQDEGDEKGRQAYRNYLEAAKFGYLYDNKDGHAWITTAGEKYFEDLRSKSRFVRQTA